MPVVGASRLLGRRYRVLGRGAGYRSRSASWFEGQRDSIVEAPSPCRDPICGRRSGAPATRCLGPRSGRSPSCGSTRGTGDATDDPRRDRADRLRGHPVRDGLPAGRAASRRAGRAGTATGRGVPAHPGDRGRPACRGHGRGDGAPAAAARRRRRRPVRGDRRVAGSRRVRGSCRRSPDAGVHRCRLGGAGRAAPRHRRRRERARARRRCSIRTQARSSRRRPTSTGSSPRRIPTRIGICLDVGHDIVGGGDPVATLRALGDRGTPCPPQGRRPRGAGGLRTGRYDGLGDAVSDGLFTELGAGALDLDGVLASLIERDYDGWLMVEQDHSFGPPSESAAIGRRVLAATLRRLGDGSAERAQREASR